MTVDRHQALAAAIEHVVAMGDGYDRSVTVDNVSEIPPSGMYRATEEPCWYVRLPYAQVWSVGGDRWVIVLKATGRVIGVQRVGE